MTMSVVNDIMTANLQNKENAEISEPSAVAIGTEFARQYYNLLADNPKSVHKFYSHESTLLMNDNTVVGQEKIGRAIENLVGEEKCRIKIVSIKGNMTLTQGIFLQVFGELSGRRFSQTFILGPQGLKKYYVQHDMFNFLDHVFVAKESPARTPTPVTVEKTIPAAAPVNGHKQIEVTPTKTEDVSPAPAATPVKVASVEKPKVPLAAAPPSEDRIPKRTPKKDEPKRKEDAPKVEAVVPPTSAPAAPAAPVDNTPKTWAKMVGGGSKATVTTVTPSGAPVPPQSKNANTKPAPPQKPAPAQKPPLKPQANGAAAANANFENRIHVGGIIKTENPDSSSSAEIEIKEAFSKYGEVTGVEIPRGAMQDNGKRPAAYAFVTMKEAADVQKILKEVAVQNDQGKLQLNIKVPSFGFEGNANVSQCQKERSNHGGFRGGRGHGFRGRGRGGVPRGGFSNNSNGQQ